MLSSQQRMLAKRIDYVYHHQLLVLLSLLVSIVLSNVPSMISIYLQEGSVAFLQLRSWWIFQAIVTDPLYLLFPVMILGCFETLLWVVHSIGHPIALMTRVRSMLVRHIHIPEWSYPGSIFIAYFVWPGFNAICASLGETAKKGGVLVLTGEPGIGKTRTALEAIRKVFPYHTLVAFDAHVLEDDLTPFAQKRLVIWLDDLDQLAGTEDDARKLVRLVMNLRQSAHSAIVVATCPASTYTALALRLSGLMRGAIICALEPLPTVQWDAFIHWVKDHAPSDMLFDEANFDGSPGSLLLALRDRTLALQQLPPAAQKTLHVLFLLFTLHRIHWPHTYIRRIVQEVFDIDDAAWIAGIEQLLADRWLIMKNNNLALTIQQYLTVCLRDLHYVPGQPAFNEDMFRLAKWLVEADCDSEIIADRNACSDWYAHATLAESNKATETLVTALVKSNFPCLDESKDTYQWAEGLRRLGCALSEGLTDMENNDDAQTAAIKTLSLALQHYPATGFEIQQAAGESELGDAFRRRGRDIEDYKQSIEHYEIALKTFTPEAFPTEYGMIQEHVGEVHGIMFEMNGELTSLNSALFATQQAQSVIDPAQEPDRWINNQTHIGHWYEQRAEWQPTDLLLAVEALLPLAEMIAPDIALLRWAATTLKLGNVITECTHRNRRPGYKKAEIWLQAIINSLHTDRAEEQVILATTHYHLAWMYLYQYQDDANKNHDYLVEANRQFYLVAATITEEAAQKIQPEVLRGLCIAAQFEGRLEDSEELFLQYRALVEGDPFWAAISFEDRMDIDLAWAWRHYLEKDAVAWTRDVQSAREAGRQALHAIDARRKPSEYARVREKLQRVDSFPQERMR